MTRIVASTFVVASLGLAVSIANADGPPDDSEAGTDELLIEAQQICPVTGRELGSMGDPVKATVGEQTVFLCCRKCLEGRIQREHWARMQANLIAAQAKCPVMNKPLPENPRSVVVENRIVYVCCPPCTRKVQAEPARYLAALDTLLRENLDDMTDE